MNTTDPFAYIQGLTKPEELKAGVDFLKIAIVGKIKTRKSWLAATMPGVVLHYDFDERQDSLAECPHLKGRTNYRIKSMRDLDQFNPVVAKELESDLSTFKGQQKGGYPIPETYIFDSYTYMKKALENELMSQSQTTRREIKLTAAKKLWIPSGYDWINGVKGFSEYFFNEFSQLGNVIWVFHQRDEKDTDKSSKDETKFTGRQTIEPQFMAPILALFNEVFYLNLDPWSGGKVHTTVTDDFTACTTLLLDAEEEPDLGKMLEKHKQAVAANKTK